MAHVSNNSQSTSFHLEEATIDDVHRAIERGELTCTQLTQFYLDRIEAYNKKLNAILHVNSNAMEIAKSLDVSFASTGKLSGPLHCISVTLKDAIDTVDMPTTAGSVVPFANSKPPSDATVVDRLRKAGAIVLAKSNMDEFSRTGMGLSTLGGQAKNAYDITRTPGGSSGGSAVAVAANLTMVALAVETGVSIRMPAANSNIVGIAPTQGLVSRNGVIPFTFTQDRVGPYARTVKDAATVLQTIAGYDPKDSATAGSRGRVSRDSYSKFLNSNGLASARLGLVRQLMTPWTPADKESVQIAERAIEDMKKAGADVIDVSAAIDQALAELIPYLDPAFLSSPSPYLDRTYLGVLDPTYSDAAKYPSIYYNPHPDFPFDINFLVKNYTDSKTGLLDAKKFPGFGLNYSTEDARVNPFELKYALNRYLALRGDSNIKTVDDINSKPPNNSTEQSGFFIPPGLKEALIAENAKTNLNDPFYIERLLRRKAHQEAIIKVMADHNLDALVYPMKTTPAWKIGTRPAPAPMAYGKSPYAMSSFGNALSALTGFPSVIMPAGFSTVVYDWMPDPNNSKKTILGPPQSASMPVGMEFLGIPFDEPTLLKIVSGYENITHHRRSPPGFGPLAEEP
ncbi:amidase [Comamonas thiooxydans]|uniref:amidase n=1 Tax=Comamonas thiooxydans TaxID=363952 RepID=UPI003D032DCA